MSPEASNSDTATCWGVDQQVAGPRGSPQICSQPGKGKNEDGQERIPALGQDMGSRSARKGITHACRGAMYSHGKFQVRGGAERGTRKTTKKELKSTPTADFFFRSRIPYRPGTLLAEGSMVG